MRVHFAHATFVGLLDPRHYASLKRVSFFHQLVNTFGIRTFNIGQALQIA